MINIRFHVVSLVAVFLALGVGVAMGASFIDRATVDNMRGRVDDLESGFRDRGDQLGAYEAMVAAHDEAASALTEERSRAIDGALEGQALVLMTPTGTPEGASTVISDVVGNAGATVVGTLQLQPSLSPELVDGELTQEETDALESALEVDPQGSTEQVEPEDLVSLARSALAEALAALSAIPPTSENAPGDGSPDESGGVTAVPAPSADADNARALLERFGQAGLITLDGAGLPAESAFPTVASVRYVLVLSAGTDPSAADWVVPFVEEYGASSRATMVVAGVEDSRGVGELPASADSAEALGVVLEPLRSGPASNEVTTVQSATEPLARPSVVFGIQAESEGVVGHFGLGPGVTAPYPPAVQE